MAAGSGNASRESQKKELELSCYCQMETQLAAPHHNPNNVNTQTDTCRGYKTVHALIINTESVRI